MSKTNELIDAISKFDFSKSKKVEEKEDDMPIDERTISISKKYLKNCKEGGLVHLKVILDDGENLILLPEENDDDKVEEVKQEKDKDGKPIKKDIKVILSEELDKQDKETEDKGEKEDE